MGTQTFVNSFTAPSSGDIITGPLVQVTYQVRNDSDSGYNGYWALDNYTQKLTIWQVSSDQYQVNAVDNGTSCTFSGAPSPNAGTIQVANGCVSMVGGYSGNLLTSVTPINTTRTTMGSGKLLFGGTENGILANNPTDKLDAYASWIDYFFPGAVNSIVSTTNPLTPGFSFANSGNAWSWTYTDRSNGLNTWTDSGTVSQASSGDIIIPAFTVSSVSATPTTLDNGQTATVSGTIGGGTGPFTIKLSDVASGVIQTVSPASYVGSFSFNSVPLSGVGFVTIPITYTVTVQDSLGNLASGTTQLDLNPPPTITSVTPLLSTLNAGQ